MRSPSRYHRGLRRRATRPRRSGRSADPCTGSRPRGVTHPKPHDRRMRDGERQRGSQRVQSADEVHVTGEDHQDRRDAREQHQREPRRLEPRMEPTQRLRQLAVGRHRVGDPRRSDYTGVGGNDEDGGGEDADVDLGRIESDPRGRCSGRRRGSDRSRIPPPPAEARAGSSAPRRSRSPEAPRARRAAA